MKTIPKRHEMIDLLIKAVDGCMWSEDMIWGLKDREEQSLMEDYIEEYIKGIDLNLSCYGENSWAARESKKQKTD